MEETVDKSVKVTQHRTKESVETAIYEEIGTRFDRASSAPICNGPLFELLGCNTNIEAGMEILEGTFVPPKGTDPATVIILNKIARIRKLIGTERSASSLPRRISSTTGNKSKREWPHLTPEDALATMQRQLTQNY